jgi:hypothetical protein
MKPLNHLDGLERIYQLRTKFSHELELVCLNSEFQEAKPLLPKAQQLQAQYPDQVVFKESELHEPSQPYYEVSVFCNEDKIDFFTQEIERLGLAVDLVHDNSESWTPYR